MRKFKTILLIGFIVVCNLLSAQTIERDTAYWEGVSVFMSNSDYPRNFNTYNLLSISFDSVSTTDGNSEKYMILNRKLETPISFLLNEIDSVNFYSYFSSVEKEIYNQVEITPDMYNYIPEENEVTKAVSSLETLFRQAMGGCYCIRGGREGVFPRAHAYQRQYSLGPDGYAQYMVVPHRDFMYGTLTSTYNVSAEFNGGPFDAYTMAKNAFMPLLHDESINLIPEIKAIYMLFYCLVAQENADLSGPFTYFEDKCGCDNPTKYDDLGSIYYGIVKDINDIIACLNNYDNRPEWYKTQIQSVLMNYCDVDIQSLMGETPSVKPYMKLANSLKLRMAMRISKVEPETAKKWAEEAVASGVIENANEQLGLYPSSLGFTHPLSDINGWGDIVLCASFESLLMSLDHPYTKYLFLKNSADITNVKTNEVTPANTKICGVRAGVLVGDGQTIDLNQRQAYSKYDNQVFGRFQPPLYFLKWAEVDFLRAEGALRGWNMGGTAQEFYERGIKNAYLEDPKRVKNSQYSKLVDAYMAQENPVEYVSSDPMGDGPDWESVTKIGVKWNEGDDNETKLEKIITQKYIALFPLSTEAWAEMRRTGYPKVFPVLNTDDGDGSIAQGEMIRRIPWVPNTPINNGFIQKYAIPALGGEDLQATRLWWDVDTPNF